MKKVFTLFVILLLLLTGATGINAYGIEEGAYIVTNTTYYVNPDTGTADDGGDTSTGEGMCRNATYTESLYELKEGKHYVTLRIKLISFISDIHFFVQQTNGDADSYSEVEYTVMGENTEENTKDFRFELPASDVLVKPQFFVGPMNRVVTYFVGLDMDTAKADEGTFASFNEAEEEAGETPVPETGTQETAAPETPVLTEPAVPESAGNGQEGGAQTPARQTETNEPGNGAGETEPDGTDQTPDEPADDISGTPSSEGETNIDSSNKGEGESEEVSGLAGFTAEGESVEVGAGGNENEEEGGSAVVWVFAAVLAVGVALFLVRRRKK